MFAGHLISQDLDPSLNGAMGFALGASAVDSTTSQTFLVSVQLDDSSELVTMGPKTIEGIQ